MAEMTPVFIAERRATPKGNEKLQALWLLEDRLKKNVRETIEKLQAEHGDAVNADDIQWTVRLQMINHERFLNVSTLILVDPDVVAVDETGLGLAA